MATSGCAQVQPKFADDEEVAFLDSEKGRFGGPNGWLKLIQGLNPWESNIALFLALQSVGI